jgi:hypothetical protein
LLEFNHVAVITDYYYRSYTSYAITHDSIHDW